jgi:hypothetical protein
MHTKFEIVDNSQKLKMAVAATIAGSLFLLLIVNLVIPLSFETDNRISNVGSGVVLIDVFAIIFCSFGFYVALFKHVHAINIHDSSLLFRRIGGSMRVNISDVKELKRDFGGYAYVLKLSSGRLYFSTGFKGIYQFLEYLRDNKVKSTEW